MQKPLEPCTPAKNVRQILQPTYTLHAMLQTNDAPVQLDEEEIERTFGENAKFKTGLNFSDAINEAILWLTKINPDHIRGDWRTIPGQKINVYSYDKRDFRFYYFFTLTRDSAK